MHRVAVVEDEELIRTMLKLNLEKAHYAVECFETAEALLERNDDSHFDILLLDIMLPGISGEEHVGRLRANGIHTPALIVTARSDI